ncbi:substrate-binding domain-containing protein [Mediterraneibacter glycyrrhizinilyticus]|uniref:substrate-binding domain-containing protein n=1 Tax=Mediterraneibacter glycyrrhizinilyticus TaxID=342942 RepID=UPI0006CF36D4
MKMKKLIAVLSMVSMVAVAAAGCGNGSDEQAADTTETKAEANTEDTKEAGTEAGDWDSSSDITIVSREDGSGTRGAFIELFGIQEEMDGEKVDMTTEEAQITNSTSVMMTTVAGDEYAIGYISLGSLDESVKALKIDGAEATAENVKSGDYKVSRPFNIATKKDLDNEVAKDFINYIMSAEGQKVVEDNGYIAVEGAEAFEGTQPSGKAVVGGSSSVSPVMEKLAEAYKEVNPNAEIELQTTDSTTGMTSAIDGSYDIGMASRELKEEEIAELDAKVIATDGIAVIVNNNNAMDELSSDQVKAIYTGEALTWDEVVE